LLENETFLNEILKFCDYRFIPGKITQLERKNDVLDILDFNSNGSAKVKMGSGLHNNIGLEAIIATYEFILWW